MLDNAATASAHADRFKIFLILAIAVQIFRRMVSSIAAPSANAFVSAATDILGAHPTSHLSADISHLEVLLLTIHYPPFSISIALIHYDSSQP
jgi:hypothetical protein